MRKCCGACASMCEWCHCMLAASQKCICACRTPQGEPGIRRRRRVGVMPGTVPGADQAWDAMTPHTGTLAAAVAARLRACSSFDDERGRRRCGCRLGLRKLGPLNDTSLGTHVLQPVLHGLHTLRAPHHFADHCLVRCVLHLHRWEQSLAFRVRNATGKFPPPYPTTETQLVSEKLGVLSEKNSLERGHDWRHVA